MRFDRPLVIVDVETTGLSPAEDRIIELAALRIEPAGSRETYVSFANPGRPLSAKIQEITRLTDADLADAPACDEVWRQFLALLRGDPILVAHNAPFDLGFLRHGCRRAGLPVWEGDWLCTLSLARIAQDAISHKLEDVAKRYGVPLDGAHRALADLEAVAACLPRLIADVRAKGVADPLNLYVRNPRYPLPELPPRARVLPWFELRPDGRSRSMW